MSNVTEPEAAVVETASMLFPFEKAFPVVEPGKEDGFTPVLLNKTFMPEAVRESSGMPVRESVPPLASSAYVPAVRPLVPGAVTMRSSRLAPVTVNSAPALTAPVTLMPPLTFIEPEIPSAVMAIVVTPPLVTSWIPKAPVRLTKLPISSVPAPSIASMSLEARPVAATLADARALKLNVNEVPSAVVNV